LRNFLRRKSKAPNAANPAENRKSSQEATMNESGAAWWASFWGQIEAWAFFGVVLMLAIEFVALKLGAPYKAQLDAAKDLKIAQLNNETARLRQFIIKAGSPRVPDQTKLLEQLKDARKATVIIEYARQVRMHGNALDCFGRCLKARAGRWRNQTDLHRLKNCQSDRRSELRY
jgi:hypothetical protein